MTRRDTILLAVLINAGLLVILFATAVTTDKPMKHAVPVASRHAEPVPVAAPIVPEQRYVVADEIDEVVNQFLAKEEAVAKAGEKRVEVTVKRGDSLERIARGNGTSVEAIMAATGLDSTTLQIGQVLNVPVEEKPQAVAAVPAPTPEELYTIRSGDNPWAIAMKFHIPLEELLSLNRLDEDSARKLKPGDRIRIR